MKVLVVDDERLARERLTRLLGSIPDVQVAGEAQDGVAALDQIAVLQPDAVFLDVQMPGLTGFDVVAELSAATRPLIVFVTAYDQYALRAFEVSAVDYLLKPVEQDRLNQTVERLRQRRSQGGLEQLLASMRKEHSLRRIIGRRLQKLHVLAVESIEAFVAENELVFAIAPDGRYLIDKTLRELEERLDPERYSRVHKQTIVNLEKLRVVEPIVRGGATARLESGATVEISRRYAQELRDKLGW